MYTESARDIPVAEVLPTETIYKYEAIVYIPVLKGNPSTKGNLYTPEGINIFDHIYATNEDDAYYALSHLIDDYLSSNGITRAQSEAAGMIEILELNTVSKSTNCNAN